jgi:hypothetical protein
VRTRVQSGVALITVMLVLILISAMVVGMSWMVMTDGRLGGNNGNREAAFYGAEAGMEKLTADLGNTFATKGSVATSDLTTITSNYPVLTGITFQNALGNSTYQIMCGSPLVSPCTPTSTNSAIVAPSPFAGMNGLITTLTLAVAAQAANGSEVKLHRQVQLVAIPVFQFGIYSDSDLSFFNGPSFSFGGRVHTNGNLWLSPNEGPLLINDKVTVVGQVIRTNLENGWPGSGSTIGTTGDYSGIVSISTAEGTSTAATSPNYNNSPWLPLTTAQSSVLGSSVYGNVSTTPNPAWQGIENGYGGPGGELTNGVSPLTLTSASLGGITTPISLIRRPVPGEATSNPAEFSQQYYSQVTLRILLDDYKTPGSPASGCAGSDMMSLNGIDTSKNPVDLTTIANIATSGAANSTVSGPFTPADGYWQTKGTATIQGCLKIEYQDTSGAFHDISSTTSPGLLSYGYRGKNINPQTKTQLATVSAGQEISLPLEPASPNQYSKYVAPSPCTDVDTTAIIRIERLRDNPSSLYPTSGDSNTAANNCGTAASGVDYWPNVLFDAREATSRAEDTNIPTGTGGLPLITAAGAMQYIELDAKNLAAWFKNNQAGLKLNNTTGFSVYFSDRRGNQIDTTTGINARTGSYGFNDFVNLTDPAHGCPNAPTLDQGEDLEGDGVLRTYGRTLTQPTNVFTPSSVSLLSSGNTTALESNPNYCTSQGNLWPGALYVDTMDSRQNPPVFFRRALKIVNGSSLALGTTCYGASPSPPCGLTIASENPVYVQGDYNAPNDGSFSGSSVAASIAGDAVTLLSDNWNDINSFIYPWDSSGRPGVQTAYRVAIIGGKGIPFPQPSGQPEDYGTDGGLHNFIRFLEDWSPPTGSGLPSGVATGGQNAYYLGSLVSFYYNRQAVGTYKGDDNQVYNPPNRVYSFDTNFTNGTQWLPPLTPNLRTINTVGFSEEIMPTQ